MIYKDSFDKIFDSLFNNYADYGTLSFNKGVQIKTDDENYSILVAVPGLSKEDMKISVKDKLIHISYEGQEKDLGFVDKFKRSYTVPEDVEEKSISAKVENGILEILLPKNKKKVTERLIAIQ